jgi:hypothetical protein
MDDHDLLPRARPGQIAEAKCNRITAAPSDADGEEVEFIRHERTF